MHQNWLVAFPAFLFNLYQNHGWLKRWESMLTLEVLHLVDLHDSMEASRKISPEIIVLVLKRKVVW